MNPIPPGVIPQSPLAVQGHLEFLLFLTVAAIVVLFVMSLRELRGLYRWRERVLCPLRLRTVRVDFRIGADGRRADVLRCSLFGRRPITCGKRCLNGAAPA
jgi:hypothetical protein